MRTSLVIVVTAFALSACSEDVPITTGPDIAYGEWVDRISISEDHPGDFLIVGRPEVIAANADLLIDAIGSGLGPYWLNWIRVAVFTPEGAVSFLESVAACEQRNGSCVPDQPQHLDFHIAPYGFGDDANQWRASAACLLSGRADCELNVGDGPAFALRCGPDVLWIDDPGTSLDRVRELFATPIQCASLHVLGGQPDGAALAEIVPGYQHHIHGARVVGVRDVVVGDDLLAACELRETLPSEGLITQCSQLDDVGRSFDGIDEAGREVCLIDRTPAPPQGVSGPPGYFYSETDPRIEYTTEGAGLVLEIESIPGSHYEWRCQIDYDSAAVE